MSGGLPLGTKYLSWAPWNLEEPEYDEIVCPKCGSANYFHAYTKKYFYDAEKNKGEWEKVRRKICRDCWNKFE
jgi:hypothetical protein